MLIILFLFYIYIYIYIQKMAINELRDFIFENYYRRIGFSHGNIYYSVKHERKDLILVILKNTMIYKKEKLKVSKTIKSNYSTTKLF